MAQNQARAEQPDDATPAQETGTRPVFTVRVPAQRGNVEIPIFPREGEYGKFHRAGAPRVHYKDGEDWKDSYSFSPVDLLAVSEAAREASAKIRELDRA